MLLVLLCWSLLAATASCKPPPVSSFRVAWENQPVRQMPIVQNFFGAATLRRDVQPGFGAISLGPITSAPFNGNFQNSSLIVDGGAVPIQRVEWGVCEAVRNGTDAAGRIHLHNQVRLPFEQHGFMQQWTISFEESRTVTPNTAQSLLEQSAAHTAEMSLDGPFFRRCDVLHNKSIPVFCGWGTYLPTDRQNFKLSLDFSLAPSLPSPVMVIQDTLSDAVAMSVLWISPPSSSLVLAADSATNTFTASVAVAHGETSVTLKQAVAVAATRDIALVQLKAMAANDVAFTTSFDDACGMFETRWTSAWSTDRAPQHSPRDPTPINSTSPTEESHFSGYLPQMRSNMPEIDRVYYWSALAMISLERTNLKTFPRNFVISEGPSNSLDGGSDMGGSGQFVWDLSFAALSLSLLEPEGTQHILEYLIRYSDLEKHPILLPQYWDAYRESAPGLGNYCFDYISTFLFIHQYVTANNATAWLFLPVESVQNPGTTVTPLQFLTAIAWSWLDVPQSHVSPYLRDYGPNKRDFLEAVETYTSVVPGLQLSNAGMLLSLASLYEQIGPPVSADRLRHDRENIAYMRGNASAIVHDTVKYQYIDGGGYWQCLYANTSLNSTGVRAISDFIYSGLSLDLLGNSIALLPENVRMESAAFFQNELLANGWVRALSLSDPLMANVTSMHPSTQDLVSMRADWTGTGGYGGLAGFAVDSLVSMQGTFEDAVQTLANYSLITHTSMPAQGVAVLTPPFMAHFLHDNDGVPVPQGPYAPAFPEFFDALSPSSLTDPPLPPFWPSSERGIQNAEASIADMCIRTLFGWRPNWVSLNSTHTAPEDAVAACLYLPHVSRGTFDGVLMGVRTPYGAIDITANHEGLSWNFQKSRE